MRIVSILWCVAIIAVFTIVLLLPGAAAVQSNNDPEMPRVLLDTHYVPPTGAVINVAAGDSFQAALNAARPGDTIILQAGVTYTTPPDGFIMPNKAGAGWVVIKSSNMAGLPGEGVRVTPGHAASMPRILTTGLWPAVSTAPGAHHYRFIGIELAVAPDLPHNYGIISLGDGSSAQNSLNVVPHDIILDRCYIHGNATGNISRGIALNSARTAVIDSYISNCHGVGYDTQAIAGWNGPGPFKIVNNYLEGAAENVMFGGSSPAIANLVPSDIEFRRNHCYKPLSWKQDDPNYGGIAWMVKNVFELKNAQRLLIDGNIFENNWVAHQSGLAIVFTPRGESGQAPWAVVQDVTFTNNIVRHSAGGINIVGYDDGGPSRQTQRVSISNNLFDDIGTPRWGVNGRFLQIIDGTAYVKVNHNTVFHTSHIIVAEGRTHTGFVYTNNISRHNSYGVFGTGAGTGISTLNSYFPGYVFARSLMADGPPNLYPPGNFFPPALEYVGFIDLSGGNYRLAAGSPYKGAGTDGRDIGADIDQLQAAIGAAVTSTDLMVVNIASPTSAVAGSEITYSISVTNNGLVEASNIILSDNMPSTVTFVTCSATSGGTCGGSGNSRTISLNSLLPGQTVTATLIATVNCTAADSSAISNAAAVSSATADYNPGNNAATSEVMVSNPNAPSVAPSIKFFGARGGIGFVNVTAAAGCAWMAESNDSWIVVVSSSGGSGNGVVAFELRENFTGGARMGTIAIAGQDFTVVQYGGSVIACGYSISPGFQVFSAGGGNGFIDVGTDAGCAWHATTSAGWLNFTSATVRIGNGRVHYTVSPNIDSTGRNAVIKIGNKVFLVKQKAG
jgi:uncharacterized repeat protein (TIGR01451 family)